MKKGTRFKKQVLTSHYFTPSYNSLERFSSYQMQIDYCIKVKPKSVLEIGIGNRIVSNFLKVNGINVVTCDFDETLRPDVVADVRKLPFKNDKFDLVMACQILEHIPFEDVPKALNSVYRITKKNVIISLPYNSFNLYGVIKCMPFVKPIKFQLRLFEYSFMEHNKNVGTGEHYWEMGKKNYSLNMVREILKTPGFKIISENSPYINPAHYFFLLEK